MTKQSSLVTLPVAGQVDLVLLLVNSNLVASKSEAKRLIKAGAVKLDGTEVLEDFIVDLYNGAKIKVGKRRWIQLKFENAPMGYFDKFEGSTAEELRVWLSESSLSKEVVERYIKDYNEEEVSVDAERKS